MSPSRATHAYSVGKRKTLSSSPEIKPPTITIAKGRCESEPMACDSAAGNRPSVATMLVTIIGPQSQNRALHRGLFDGMPARSPLIDVLQHDHAGLHRNAEQREKPDAGRHAEVGVGQQAAPACRPAASS